MEGKPVPEEINTEPRIAIKPSVVFLHAAFQRALWTMDGAANPCKMVVSQLTNLAAVIKDVDRKVNAES